MEVLELRFGASPTGSLRQGAQGTVSLSADYEGRQTQVRSLYLTNPTFHPGGGKGSVRQATKWEEVVEGLKRGEKMWALFEAVHEAPDLSPSAHKFA